MNNCLCYNTFIYITNVVILKILETGNEDESTYVGIDDEETMNAVYAIFKEKFKDVFNFID